MKECGTTLVELLVASAVGIIVLLGIGWFYLSTLRFSAQSSSQTFLQRQGTLIIDEMARQIVPANGLTKDPPAPNNCPANPSLWVSQPGVTGFYCFYLSGNTLFERRPDGSNMNLLSGSPAILTVNNVVFAVDPSQKRTAISFQLRDDKDNSMAFTIDLVAQN